MCQPPGCSGRRAAAEPPADDDVFYLFLQKQNLKQSHRQPRHQTFKKNKPVTSFVTYYILNTLLQHNVMFFFKHLTLKLTLSNKIHAQLPSKL
jgi:hypothetical protein